MPTYIFNKAQYETDLGITNTLEQSYLGRVLKFVELEIAKRGIIITTDNTPSAKKFDGYNGGRATISTPYLHNSVYTLTKKRYSNETSEILIENSDFKVSRFNQTPNPIIQIDLITPLYSQDDYLEVNGVWKFSNLIPEDIDFEVFDFVQSTMNNFLSAKRMQNQSGQMVKSTTINDIKREFFQVQSESKSISQMFAERSALGSIINKYSRLYG